MNRKAKERVQNEEWSKPAKKRGMSFLMLVVLLIVLSAARPVLSQIPLPLTWQTGTSHPKEAGANRALIFIAHCEDNDSPDIALNTVSYGGQPMDLVTERRVSSGSPLTRAYVAAFILNDAGVNAASGNTFSVSWNQTPDNTAYASVFLKNVNQTTLIGDKDGNSITSSDTIATSELTTNDGDMVIVGATCGHSGSYVFNNGFTEGTEQSFSSSTGATGHKSATGGSETPSVTYYSGANRQVIIVFVVQAIPPDPNKATHPDPGNGVNDVSISTDLSWDAPTGYTPTSYDVYFGTDTTSHNNPKYTVYTNSYDPLGDLAEGTTYYWAVDCNDNGTIYTGDEWSFTTFKPGDRVVGNMMLINDNAGWCWYQDDKIVYDPVGFNIITSTAAHSLGFGGVSGTRANDIDATTFNINTGKRTRVLVHDFGWGDDHHMGAMWVRPDGRYLNLYCPHYSGPPNPPLTYYRLSTNPNDGSAWESEQSFNWSTISGISVDDGGELTYTNIHYLSAEGAGNGRLYDIARWNNVTPNIAYSDDWGQTWNYMGRLNSPSAPGYSNYYHKFRSNDVDRIDFVGCEQHPRNYNNSVFHGYIQGGKSYDSYGNVIDDDLYDQDAPSIEAFTPIFVAADPQLPDTYHTGWTNELELDENGYPVCLYQTRYGTEDWGEGSGQNTIGAADHRFFYARFDGSTWTATELGRMGTGLHTPEQDYIGMGCIHPDNVNVIYISTPFDPRDDTPLEHHEIFKGVTSDFGATWDWTQITFDSTEDNIRPAIPQWDANNTAVFWERGSYPAQGQFDMVMVGLVEEQGMSLGLVSYIDATESNTEESDGSPFTPTGPSGSSGSSDNQWHEYTGYGNGGSCYTAGDGGTENAPTIKTTIVGLADGTYDVFAYFWCDPELDWGVRGGFTSSDMLCFNRQSSQHAEASQFSDSVEVVDDEAVLYRVYIGRQEVSEGSSIDVYIDNYDSSFSGNIPTRTTYDGVGVASMITGLAGDLNNDGKVNLIDIAVLGQGWQSIYDIYTLADIANNWLAGTEP